MRLGSLWGLGVSFVSVGRSATLVHIITSHRRRIMPVASVPSWVAGDVMTVAWCAVHPHAQCTLRCTEDLHASGVVWGVQGVLHACNGICWSCACASAVSAVGLVLMRAGVGLPRGRAHRVHLLHPAGGAPREPRGDPRLHGGQDGCRHVWQARAAVTHPPLWHTAHAGLPSCSSAPVSTSQAARSGGRQGKRALHG